MKKSAPFVYAAIPGCTVRADMANPRGPSPFGVFYNVEAAEQFVCRRLPRVQDAHGWMPLDISAFSIRTLPDQGWVPWRVTYRFASGTKGVGSDHILDVEVYDVRSFDPSRP